MFDPIGPGTPAWNEADKAIAAYRVGNKRSAWNHTYEMKRHLKKHNADWYTIHRFVFFIRNNRYNEEYEI